MNENTRRIINVNLEWKVILNMAWIFPSLQDEILLTRALVFNMFQNNIIAL